MEERGVCVCAWECWQHKNTHTRVLALLSNMYYILLVICRSNTQLGGRGWAGGPVLLVVGLVFLISS